MPTSNFESKESFRTIDDIIRFYSKSRTANPSPKEPGLTDQAPSSTGTPSVSKPESPSSSTDQVQHKNG